MRREADDDETGFDGPTAAEASDGANGPGGPARDQVEAAKPSGVGRSPKLIINVSEEGEESEPLVARVDSLPGGSLSRQVLMLALPMLGEQVGIFTIGLVDTYLAGHVSKEATAAVGTGAYIAWFFSLAFMLIGVGATALVSRAFGGRDLRTANRTLNQAFLLAVIFGLTLALAAHFAAPLFAEFLSATEISRGLCQQFLRIDAFGYFALSLNLVGAAILRGSGNTRTPMRIMIMVNIINAAISTTLVFGWLGEPQGVRGIVVGTLIARCAGGALMALVLMRGISGLRVRIAQLRPDFEMIRRLMRIGLPSAGESAAMGLAQLIFIYIIRRTAEGDLGTANYAAHMIAMRAEAVGYLPAFAWATAAATVVGQYLGAGRAELARRGANIAAAQGLVVAFLVGIAFYLFSNQIFATLTTDPQVRAVGGPAFRFAAFAQPVLALGIIFVGALRGAGDTRWPMLFTFVSSLGVRTCLAYVGGIVLRGGLIGAWCGMWGDNTLRFVLCYARFRHGGWKRVRV